MKKDLTERQSEILNYIIESIKENGFPPTLREIGARFNISSTNGVKRHIDALKKKGYITTENNLSRSLCLTEQVQMDEEIEDLPVEKIPLVGRVAAGYPVLAEENIEDFIPVDKNILRNKTGCFALKVRGDSMINAGILDGDTVVVVPSNVASNNEIVVAMLDNEVTLKRFLKLGNRLCLMPENENYPIIEVNKSNSFAIIGKVVAVFRFYN